MKARCAFGFGPLSTILLTFFIITMLFAPIIVRMSEKVGLDKFAIVMAYVGYFWFGLFFLFFCASVLFDIWRLVVYLIGLTAGKDLSPITGAFRLYFYIAVLCAMSIACYGFFEAECIKTERIVIHTDKLPRGMNSLRIVQISDVHLGLIVREERLRKIIYEIKKAKPDMLVSTGDLFDGQTDSMNSLARLFMEVEPRFGKFAITGNHEFYAGISNFISFALESGFKVLRGDAVTIEGAINVAGVDDITGIHFHQYETVEEKRLLGGLDRDRFTLLLKHRPVIDKSALGLFDLQLSGHTHKGQIYPFYYIVRMVFPFTAGYYDLGGNSRLYVSRGTGIWGPPIRFMSPPEVTLIELRSGVNIPE
jgi:predicted MPP superfamily phosphohydrolase